MPTDFELKWYGAQILEKIRSAYDEGYWEAGHVILDEAKAKVPVRTGRLRDSGYVRTWKRSSYGKKRKGWRKQRDAERNAGLVAFAMFYSHMVERGTIKMAARPFMRTAIDTKHKDAARTAFDVIKRRLEELKT